MTVEASARPIKSSTENIFLVKFDGPIYGRKLQILCDLNLAGRIELSQAEALSLATDLLKFAQGKEEHIKFAQSKEEHIHEY